MGAKRFSRNDAKFWQQNCCCWLCFVMLLIKFLTGARPKIAPHKTKNTHTGDAKEMEKQEERQKEKLLVKQMNSCVRYNLHELALDFAFGFGFGFAWLLFLFCSLFLTVKLINVPSKWRQAVPL